MLKRVALAAAASLLPCVIAAHPAIAQAPDGTSPSSRHRADLVGTRLDPSVLAPSETVSVIVELDGAPAPERAARAPLAGELAATRAVLREQRGVDFALRLAGATVTGRLTQTMNAVTVRVRASDVARLERAEGVKGVQVARRVSRANGLANATTGVPAVWQDVGLTGVGVTIGFVDDGIDYTHADFGGSGNPADFIANDPDVVEAGTFPTAKVVGGWDFVGDDYDADEIALDTPAPDGDPLACATHGTHVAGTAAGFGVDDASGQRYSGGYDAAALAGVSFRVAPGAAPLASVRAYKVFGCVGSSDDSVIIAAIDRAVADHVDILNLSLGEGLGTGSTKDLVVKAVQRATALGTLVVASAGNGGGGPYLASTPSTANGALSVAAYDSGPTTFPGVGIDTVPAIVGAEANEHSIGAGITGPLKVVVPGCEDGAFSGLTGTIVVVSAVDGCVSPLFDALQGVLAVVVVVEDYFRAGFLDVAVPFVVVRQSDAAPLLAANGATVTLSPSAPIADPEWGGLAGFSSGGPRRGDAALKPDLVAPGSSVRSAREGSGSGAIEFSGTSMSSPHVAGIAALVAQAHPTWKPLQVKAVLMTTADPGAVAGFDPLQAGTGLVSAQRAVTSVAYASTTEGRQNLSFGLLTLRNSSMSRTKQMRITNTSATPITYDLSVAFTGASLGSTVTVAPTRVTVPARSSRTVGVRLRIHASVIPTLPSAAASDFGEIVAIRGVVTATPTSALPGVYPLRMAFAAVPKALSSISAPTRVSGSTVNVRNFGKHAGTVDVFQWLFRDRLRDNEDPEVPDLMDIGVRSEPDGADRLVVFAINLRTTASTHSSQAFVVDIDVDGDSSEDFLVVGGDEGLLRDGPANGRFVALTVDAATFLILDAFDTEAPLNTSVVYLRTRASALGANDSTVWNLWVTGTSLLLDDLVQDEAPDTAVLTYSPYHPLIDAAAGIVVQPRSSVAVPFTVDRSQPQSGRGLLVVAVDDAPGTPTANRVTVSGL